MALIKPSHVGLLHESLGIPKDKKIGTKRLLSAKANAKKTGNSVEMKRATFALNFNK